MAQNLDINSIDQNINENTDFIQLKSDSDGNINIPEGHFIGDADISRDGQNLILEFSEDSSFIVENYFTAENDSMIQDSSGSVLTSGLVNSFAHSSPEYAQNSSMNDESPVGAVEELKGKATVTHVDGTTENITLGSPIYEGDVIQTSGEGAVNIIFSDETSMAVSENARIAIDNYKFDATTESGETNLSVLRGVFVYTSGLIGRDDPDDVEINTPVGSIGIRGTIIAGHINPEGQSEISVLEGAIVIKNGSGERTLSQQYETVKLSSFQEAIDYQGVGAASDIGKTYGSVSDVLPKLFSSIDDATKEEVNAQEAEEEAQEEVEASEEAAEEAETQEEVEASEETSPDPTIEIIQDNPGFGAEGAVENDPAASKNFEDPKNKNSHTKRKIEQKEEHEDNLYQEAKDFTEDPQIIGYLKPLYEQSKSGLLVGSYVVKGYPPGTTIHVYDAGTTTDSSNFTVAQVGSTNKFEIALNVANIGVAGSTLPAIDIVAVLPDSSVIPIKENETPTALDAVVNLNSPGGYEYAVNNIGNAPSPLNKIGDFNGDGNNDFASINALSELEIEDVPGSVLFSDNTETYSSIAGVGDIDNDGFADVIVGSSTSSSGKGDAFLIHGTNAAPVLINKGLAGTIGDQEGSSVAGIGDYDGDGKSDFAIGSPGLNASATDDGQVILHLSNSTNPDIDGHIGGQFLGGHVAGIGDINGDGYSDILLGNADGSTNQNEAYISYGNAGGTAQVSTATMIKISADGQIVAGSAAGDLNGDGFDDFAVSVKHGADIDTYVIYGKSANFGTTEIDMTYLENPDHALKINHAGVSGASDYSISSVGDIDGDGFDDLQVGVSGGNQYIVYGDLGGSGANYVVDGAPNDGDSNDGGVTATGTGQSLVGDVDFYDGDKDALSMKGGGSNNTFQITDNAFKNIDGGTGFDTIKFVSAASSLDFSNKNFEDISQIENIEFGAGGQTITLTAENIFNMLKSSDNGELRITGIGTLNLDVNGSGGGITAIDVTDALNEQGSGATFVGGGPETLDGEDYWHYNIGGYDLYIDTDITPTLV